MAERTVKISVDPDDVKFSVEFGGGVGSTGFKPKERDAKEQYGSQLLRDVSVENIDGSITDYPGNCHLVERPDAGGVIQAMNDEEYVAFSGRPDSANED